VEAPCELGPLDQEGNIELPLRNVVIKRLGLLLSDGQGFLPSYVEKVLLAIGSGSSQMTETTPVV
jgi:hypothetical protein